MFEKHILTLHFHRFEGPKDNYASKFLPDIQIFFFFLSFLYKLFFVITLKKKTETNALLSVWLSFSNFGVFCLDENAKMSKVWTEYFYVLFCRTELIQNRQICSNPS